MNKSRKLIASIVRVRCVGKAFVGPDRRRRGYGLYAWITEGEYDAVAYDPRHVRMVKINGSRVDVIPKNGGER